MARKVSTPRKGAIPRGRSTKLVNSNSTMSFQPLEREPSPEDSSYPQWETTRWNRCFLTGSWALYTTLACFIAPKTHFRPTVLRLPRVSKSNRIFGLISFFINVVEGRFTPTFRRFSRSITLNRSQRASVAVCHFSVTFAAKSDVAVRHYHW